jgi:hypothetical protein
MRKILNISFAFCLLGAMSSLFYSIDQSDSIQNGKVFMTLGDSINGEQDVSIISRSYLFLSFAEINQNVQSEVDSQKSFSANWSTNQNTYPPLFEYLIRAQRLLLSQSVRILIFPFHSFL